jgi:hypothetical protein
MKRILLFGVFSAVLVFSSFAQVSGGLKLEYGVDGLPFSLLFGSSAWNNTEDGFVPPALCISRDVSEPIPEPAEETVKETNSTSFDFGNFFFFPLGSLGLYGQLNLGPVHFGLGLKGYNVIAYSLIWPAFFVEYEFFQFAVRATVGGYAFAVTIALLPIGTAQTRNLLIPDLALWYRPGNLFKFGFGVFSFLEPEELPTTGFDFWDTHWYVLARWDIPLVGLNKKEIKAAQQKDKDEREARRRQPPAPPIRRDREASAAPGEAAARDALDRMDQAFDAENAE